MVVVAPIPARFSTALKVSTALTVSVNYPVSKLNQVLPFLVLPGVGVPNLPNQSDRPIESAFDGGR